jgi:hypothetical protein
MGQTFRGGIPYAIDVGRLKEAFSVSSLIEGRIISHDELENIVKVGRGTQRYYSVINSWIAGLRNTTGLFLAWEVTIGVKVLNPAEVLSHAETRTRQKIGQTGKALKTYQWVDRDRLDSIGQRRLDHQMHVASVMRSALDNARKDMAVSLAPVQSLPQRKLIRGA